MSKARDIKSNIDIVQLIGKTVKLKKVGTEYFGLCPFHKDTRPSLSVNDQKQTWYCHGCNVGGDCFDWVQKTYRVNFEESIKILNQEVRKIEKQIVAIYSYIDSNGKPFEVVRTSPKGFYQRRPDGKGGYINNLKGIVPTLYHQDELKQAIDNHIPIYIVEGKRMLIDFGP